MKRREFITVIGSAAAARPLAAWAQQREKMSRIGVLMNLTADDAEGQARDSGGPRRLAVHHRRRRKRYRVLGGLQQLGKSLQPIETK
jgi:hypothetical protein